MFLSMADRAAAANDAVRLARQGADALPGLIALILGGGHYSPEAAGRAAKRISVYTKHERIREPPGSVVFLIAGAAESEKEIGQRSQKARKLGARFVGIIVPHLIRLDVAPDYLEFVDAVFFAPALVGSELPTHRLGKCYELKPSDKRVS